METPKTKGTFSCVIPLRNIFGFAEDYDKVVYGMTHTMTLVRKPNANDALFTERDFKARVRLSKLIWMMP